MSFPQIDGLTLIELQELHELVLQAIATKREQAVAEMRERMQKEAEAAGLSLEQVLGKNGGTPRKRKKRVPPKYKNPDNPKQTWSGKTSKQPPWVAEQLAKGKTLDELAI